MLHKMSELRGWSHEEMMAMSKELFYRYFGYWYAERFNEMMEREWENRKHELEAKSQERKQARGW